MARGTTLIACWCCFGSNFFVIQILVSIFASHFNYVTCITYDPHIHNVCLLNAMNIYIVLWKHTLVILHGCSLCWQRSLCDLDFFKHVISILKEKPIEVFLYHIEEKHE